MNKTELRNKSAELIAEYTERGQLLREAYENGELEDQSPEDVRADLDGLAGLVREFEDAAARGFTVDHAKVALERAVVEDWEPHTLTSYSTETSKDILAGFKESLQWAEDGLI